MKNQNIILALGSIGIARKDDEQIPKKVMQFFIQILGKNDRGSDKSEHALDSLIINTMADMWINGTVS